MNLHAPSPFDDGAHHSSRQQILKKGRACVNCRRKKMKCDGVQPICGSCLRADKVEDCEYTQGSEKSTSQLLEAQVQRLQTRLDDLQTTPDADRSITLQLPYTSDIGSSHTNQQQTSFQEPPYHVAQKLCISPSLDPPSAVLLTHSSVLSLEIFLAHGSQYGFFLHPARFKGSVTFPAPVGHPSRPAPALLATMYLFGVYLDRDPEIQRHEKTYLDLAIRLLSQDTLSTMSNPHHRLDIIQSELLLSNYFFSQNRVMEGRYHIDSAYSLAIASGIHKMKTRNPPESGLPTPRDDIEEGERVNAFWEIVCSDCQWAGAFGNDANLVSLSGARGGSVRLTTPFPREIEEYQTGSYICDGRTGHSLEDFLNGTERSGESLTSRTLHVKASLIFERSRALSRMSGMELSHKQRTDFMDNYRHIHGLALSFKHSLPSFEFWLSNPSLDITRTAYVSVMLLNAGLIILHGIAAANAQQGQNQNEHQHQIINAQEIFDTSIQLATLSWKFGVLNPIIGFAWREAFDVLYNEMNGRKSSWNHQGVGNNLYCHQLEQGVLSFGIHSNGSPFIGAQVEEMKNILRGVHYNSVY